MCFRWMIVDAIFSTRFVNSFCFSNNEHLYCMKIYFLNFWKLFVECLNERVEFCSILICEFVKLANLANLDNCHPVKLS